MKLLEKRYFISWLDNGEKWATALLPANEKWFEVAINVYRGSDRGDPDNVWVCDEIYDKEDIATMRPATSAEVDAWMRECWKQYLSIRGCYKEKPIRLVKEKEPYILFELKK